MKGPNRASCPLCAQSIDRDASSRESLRQREVVRLVIAERIKQDQKWGEQNHSAEIWMAILGEEFGEACQALLADTFGRKNQREKKPEMMRDEIVQVAAVAIAILEWMNRSGYGR